MAPFEQQMSDSDEALIERFKATGSNQFIGELYKRYTHLVYGSCMKYLKDEDEGKDMVMQVFEKLLNRLKTETVQHFKSWLYIVVKNECLMHIRKKQQIENSMMEIKNSSVSFMEIDPGVHLNEKEKERIMQLMEKGITELSKSQRNCIELFYLKEKSYQEVADITGLSLNEVKSHLQNGKRNLKLYMERSEKNE